MNFFIRLKHWQLFLLLLSLVIVVSITDEPGATRLKLASNLFSYGIYICWLWSIANFLSRRLNRDVKIPVSTMLIAFFCFVSVTIYQFIKFDSELQPPILIYSIFFSLLFYSLAKIGTLLKDVETPSNMNYSKSFVYAILLFVFPIGIWVIQPKINRLSVKR